MSDKKSFVLYNDYIKHISRLSDEEAGQLFKAIFQYAETGEASELSDRAEMAFSFISEQMSRDFEKWESIRKKRSEAIKKRWEKERQNDTNVYKSIQNDTNDTVSVTVNDNVNVNGNVNDNVINKGGMGGTDKPSHPPKPKKHKYGQFRHVLLTDEQYTKLVSDFGESTTREYIRKIDEWIQLKGKSPYKDYSLAIRNWIKKDDEGKNRDDDFDVEKYKIFINDF